MAIIKLFEGKNVLITLKAWVAGVLTSFAYIPFALILLLTEGKGRVLFMIAFFVIQLFLYGYIARRLWKWK